MHRVAATTEIDQASTPRGAPEILFVDDDEAIRRVFSRAMQQRGFLVAKAADGNSATSYLLDSGNPKM